MSVYTMQLRYLIDEANDFDTSLSWDEKIRNARKKIFNFSYPIWNEDYRETLEVKILYHYFNYEIGLETPMLWQMYLRNKMNEIMPFYNQMYMATIPYSDKIYVNRDYTDTTKSKNANTLDKISNRNIGKETTVGSTESTTNDTISNTQKTEKESESLNTTSNNTVNKNGSENITDSITKNDTETQTGNKNVTKTGDNTTTKNGVEDTANTDKIIEANTYNRTYNETTSNIEIVSQYPQTTLNDLDYATESTSNSGSKKFTQNDTDDKTKTDTFNGKVTTTDNENEKINETNTEEITNNINKNGTETEKTDKTNQSTDTENKTTNSTDVTDNTMSSNVTNNSMGNKKVDEQETQTTKDNITETETETETVDKTFSTLGLQGKTYAELIMEYLPAIQNIDMKIINDLKPLFMLVF